MKLVAKVADITHRAFITLENGSKYVALQDNGIWIVADAVCPHSGGPLHLGDIEDMEIVCPWHEYRFDLKTGFCEHSLSINIIDTKIINGSLYADFNDEIAKIDHFQFAKRPKNIEFDQPKSTTTLCEWAVKILCTPDSKEKVELTIKIANSWNRGELEIGQFTPPDTPIRTIGMTDRYKIKPLKKSAQSVTSRIRILHSLANVEQWAIDLAWDIIARFSQCSFGGQSLPKAFFDDFVRVAYEEATHFQLLVERLQFYDSNFGSLPVHDGLWESASETSHDLLARLAIVHMVHEARGLDVNPATIKKFRDQDDHKSVESLEKIHNDEITHVACGQRWFSWICDKMERDRYETFHSMVRTYFRGKLKPPFNEKDRLIAGLDVKYYLPVSSSV